MGGLLKNMGCVENEFVVDLVIKVLIYFGCGLWLVVSDCVVKWIGMLIVIMVNYCEYE